MLKSGSRMRIAERAALFLVFFSLAALSPAAAAPRIYLDVSKEAGKKISLAVTPMAAAEGEMARDIRGVLEKDLVVSGIFKLLPFGSLQRELFALEEETGKVQFSSWSSWKAELLLRPSFHVEGDTLVLKGNLYDVGRKVSIFGREYRGRKGQQARMAHSLSNDIVKTLTGQEGIALTKILFARPDGGVKRIHVMDYDGERVRPISPKGVLSLYPAWFPDGTRIAYVSYRQGRTEIVVHNLETQSVRSLAFFPGMNAFPDLSPDGRSMLLTLSRDGNPEIYRMEVDSSSLQRITFTKAVEASPVWSPNMRKIAFVSDRTGSPQIFTSSPRGGRAKRVSYTGRYSTSPDWSPKGNLIVFTSLTEGTFQLFVADLESNQNEQLTFDGGSKEDPSWAPNGRHLVFSQGRGTNYQLYILDTLTGKKTPIPRGTASYTSPAWSP